MQVQKVSRLWHLLKVPRHRGPCKSLYQPSRSLLASTPQFASIAQQTRFPASFALRRRFATVSTIEPEKSSFISLMSGDPSTADFKEVDGGKYSVYQKPLEKAFSDDREYRLIRLPNQMEALIIHDKTTDKASAALDVHVGHLSDPKEFPGLAHFCEHLLFMGTEKYPKENEYSQFLAEHFGSSNAYTGLDETNYFFEVGHEHLEGALDRFAQFFISPLFDPSCTDRELNAVDSEHKKNLQDDLWRMYQLEKSLSNPNHPFSKFGTGNLKSLREDPEKSGLHPREELLKWHAKYYSANIMKLVIIGRESLDQLSNWVVEKFSSVQNKSQGVPSYPGKPLTANELGVQVFAKPVKDVRGLEISFPFPDSRPLFRTNPGRYLSHLIGHEGEGSILSLLKKRGWANYMSAGLSSGSIGFDFFKINTDLTEEGLAHYKEVIAIIFQYIRLLRESGPQESIFREVEKLNEIAFRFQEKTSPSKYTSGLASTMQKPYPREWILSGYWLLREYNAMDLRDAIQLLRTDNFKVTITSQEVPGVWKDKEPWYGTEYTIEPIDAKFRAVLEDSPVNKDLHLPKPNRFVPYDFETHKREVANPSRRPFLIKHSPLIRVWHKKDDTFWLPKANFFIQFTSLVANSTPENAVMTRLYVELVRDALIEYAYDAEVAGIAYALSDRMDGMQILMDGYNDKMPLLLDTIITRMKTFQILPDRFEKMKELLKRSYKNWNLEPPYQHATYFVQYLTESNKWSIAEKAAVLDDITLEHVQTFIPDLLGKLRIETMILGNFFKDDAVQIASSVADSVGSTPLSEEEAAAAQVRSLRVPRGSKIILQRKAFDSKEVNSGIEFFLPVGPVMDHEMRAKLTLLAQIFFEPFFDQLRTKEQLGYLVFSGIRSGISSHGLRFIIQSERDAIYLENRIESFLRQMEQHINDMPANEFEQQKKSAILRKEEKPKNLFEEGTRYWAQIQNGYYHFEQRLIDIENLKVIKKEDLLQFFREYVHPDSPTRTKISVHIRSHESDAKRGSASDISSGDLSQNSAIGDGSLQAAVPDQLEIPNGNLILQTDEEIASFKSSLEVEPAPRPVKDWNDFLHKL